MISRDFDLADFSESGSEDRVGRFGRVPIGMVGGRFRLKVGSGVFGRGGGGFTGGCSCVWLDWGRGAGGGFAEFGVLSRGG